MKLFRPLLSGAHLPDRLIACAGATIAIMLTILICAELPFIPADLPIIVAPMGASAVLIFAVPASPLAQPWPVVGGNILSTLIGVTAFNMIPNATVAAGAAVGGAILVMSLFRCLHPPGGAAALTAVIGGPGIHAAQYGFAFAPVGIASIALVSIGMMFHHLSAHSYPHIPMPMPPDAGPPGLHADDIDAALAEMHESFDISRDDLDALLLRAEHHARMKHIDRR